MPIIDPFALPPKENKQQVIRHKDNKRWAHGEFIPKNKQKYVGKYPIIFRSSWELKFMRHCDDHPSVIAWASESIKIPYIDPFDNKHIRNYIPDFLIKYTDKNGATLTELIEIKPLSQSINERTRSKQLAETRKFNDAKWGAAKQWCALNNIGFRIMTEKDIFEGK